MMSKKNIIVLIVVIAIGVAGTYFLGLTDTNKEEVPKAKLHMFYTDENGKPLKDVEVQIIDKNNNVVDTILTDVNGFGKSNDLLLGTYYYKQKTVPDGIVADEIKYDFYLSKPGQILEAFVECEIEK